VHDPDLRMGVEIKLAPKARAALGGTGAHDRMDSMLPSMSSNIFASSLTEK
jgi:hypothetical protein